MKLKVNKNVLGLVLFILIGSALSYIYLAPFLEFKDTMFLRLDWHKEFQMTSANWISIAKYHEFPFWNPYIEGGNFLFAHPESHVFSPETILVLIFGPITGLYYSVLFFYILGFTGCYFIGRHLRFSFLGTLYLAIIFTFSSNIMNNLFMGASTWMPFGYIPFVFYFLLKAENNWRYGIAGGFFLALMYLGGMITPFMLFILFIIIFVGSNIIIKRNLNYAKGLAALFLFTLLFSSIKMLPNLDLFEVTSRKSGGFEIIPFGLDLMHKVFLDKNQAWNIVSAYTYKGVNFHFPSYGDYIGIIPLLLALIGLILWLKNKAWVLAFFGSLLLYLSSYGPFSFIWEIIHLIPPFSVLQRPARSVLFFALMVSIIGAKLISKIDRTKIKDSKELNILKSILIFGLVLFIFVDLTKASYIITNNFKPWPMENAPPIIWEEPFEYHDFHARYNVSEEQLQILDANYLKSMSHFNTLSNKGSINRVHDPMRISKGVAKSKEQPDYKGEYYFEEEGNNEIELIKRTANKISLKLKTEKDNVLVINQNYVKAWKNKEGFEIINKEDLVAVKIPGGEHIINLYVFQNKILIGILLFSIGLISGLYFLSGIYRTHKKSANP